MEQEQQNAPKTKNNTTTIVIIIVAVFLVLAIGGYFSWKYYFKAKFNADANPTVITTPTTTTTTKNNAAFTLTQLEEMIKYPNGTLTSTDRSQAGGYTSILTMETDDSIVTANNYYLSLNSAQKWTVTSKALESDGSRADITLLGTKDKFTVAIIIDHNYEKTDILVRIDAEDLPVGTPLGTNSTTAPTVAASTPTVASQTGITPTNSYIIADSNARVVSESELTSLTSWQLKVARNEIYARHGRAFVHKDLQCYFAKQSWYKIDTSFTESVLSTIETKNIATIQAYEQKTGSPLQSFDSGCKS